MNKIIMYGAVLAGLLASCSQNSKTFTINGTVDDEIHATAFYVYIGDEDFRVNSETVPLDTITVNDKKFTYSVDVDYPTFFELSGVSDDGSLIPGFRYWLVPGETIDLKLGTAFIKYDGSNFYHQVHNFLKMIDESDARKQINKLFEQLQNNPELERDSVWNVEMIKADQDLTKTMLDYLIAHNNEEGAFIEACLSGAFAPVQLFDSIAAPEIRNGRFSHFIDLVSKDSPSDSKYMAQLAENKLNTLVGTMFKDFVVEYNGKTQKLSDYVGKGQYVLVDFWASWCGPCRGEIPNLINVYNKYKDKNLNILGVMVWDAPEDSEAAIKELGVNYPQMINTDDSCPFIYGIDGVPHVILFGPDGRILERELFGEEVEAAVRKHLKL
ncbi:MAG: AhpC/TSA family protein [Salinivirgaceae bacterium]|nr:AhpC/TSA family protein [Salinivirgaceae bacterium]